MIISKIPGDKSISHRAIIIASLATGVTMVEGFLCSDDCLATLAIFQQLGVDIERSGTSLTINSLGISGFRQPKSPLNVGNSGTGIRLITGILSTLPFDTQITGDASIQQRPMARIIDPLTQMGAVIESGDGTPPLLIRGGQSLSRIDYSMPIASAQVKSSILLAGVAAGVPVTITEPELCRDHTERMLRLFGVKCITNGSVIDYDGQPLTSPNKTVQIPADISSALFMIVFALLKNESVTLTNIGLNPSRTGCLEVLKLMNAPIEIIEHDGSYEPMGDIVVNASKNPLQNITVPDELIANIIDECPILAILATKATGTFTVRNAKELRVKESDRIDGICRLINALGGQVVEHEDGFEVIGPINAPSAFSFDAHFDHRLAMSALIAGKVYGVEADVNGTDSIATSFPNFFELLNSFTKPWLS